MKRFAALTSALILASLTLNACAYSAFKKPAFGKERTWRLHGHAMIAAADPRAVEAGLEMLKRGGSSVDAAIATEMVLGLVEPQSSGLGGGGMMLSYNYATQNVRFFDGRETAPQAATPTLFLDESGRPFEFSTAAHSGLSVGAPGLVPMLELAHEKEGKLPWADLFQPAIKLAEEGFEVSQRLNLLLTMAKAGRLDDIEPSKSFFYDSKGAPLPAGSKLKNPAYANTLRTIAKKGAAAMQQGAIAQRIVQSVRSDQRPGALSLADLSAYKPIEREAICAPYRTYHICSAPPPGGGVGVLSALGILERQPNIIQGPQNADALGIFIDSSRLAYADRDYYVADPDQIEIPIKGLIDAHYLATRAKLIESGKRLAAASPGDPARPAGGPSLLGRWAGDKTDEVPGTTHLSVVDENGDVVALTATVEAAFGNQRMTDGFVLNNQLTDFAIAPSLDGRPFANAPGPSKRPRSSMAPTIIFDRHGDFYAATGSPGGSSIIAYTLKTIVGMVDWGLSPQDAAALPNIVARSGVVRIEFAKSSPEAISALQARGYKLVDATGEASGLHIVRAGASGYEGGADPRREGVAKGY